MAGTTGDARELNPYRAQQTQRYQGETSLVARAAIPEGPMAMARGENVGTPLRHGKKGSLKRSKTLSQCLVYTYVRIHAYTYIHIHEYTYTHVCTYMLIFMYPSGKVPDL